MTLLAKNFCEIPLFKSHLEIAVAICFGEVVTSASSSTAASSSQLLVPAVVTASQFRSFSRSLALPSVCGAVSEHVL